MISLLLAVFAFSCTIAAGSSGDCNNSGRVIACYYGSWAVYRKGYGRFSVDDIDPTLCTHIIYSFAGLDQYGGISSLDTYNDLQLKGYYNFTTNLKLKNPCIKTTLAIGGWNSVSRLYSVVIGTDGGQNAFIDSIMRFIVNYGFDGLDFDWEYPTQRGGIPEDKTNFATFLRKLKSRFRPYGLLLNIAVPMSIDLAKGAYDIPAIRDSVDFVQLMAYDYTSTQSPVTGLLAPLSPIKESVKYWLDSGLPSEKLLLGLPTYARSFELKDANQHGIGAPILGPGREWTFTSEPGFLSYYEVTMKLQTGKYTTVVEDNNCYVYYVKDWMSYDSPETYEAKVKYAIEQKLGGVMVWSIDTDDFLPLVGKEKFPVLQTINRAIKKYS